MAISTGSNSIAFTGNGSTVTAYVIPFRYDDPDWLVVTRVAADSDRSVLALNTGFTLDGQNLRTIAAIPGTDRLEIRRNTPARQTVDSVGPVQSYATAVEAQLDRTTMALQDAALGVRVDLDRALSFPVDEPDDSPKVLPTPSARKDTVIFFDQGTGELRVLNMDALAMRLLVILGAEAVLPYRVKEVTASRPIDSTDSNAFLRINASTDVTITLPITGDDFTSFFDQSFSCEISRIGSGAVQFMAADGVVIDSQGGAFRIFGQFSSVAVRAVGVNHWQIYGDLY
jgi:hypothetical protein